MAGRSRTTSTGATVTITRSEALSGSDVWLAYPGEAPVFAGRIRQHVAGGHGYTPSGIHPHLMSAEVLRIIAECIDEQEG